jgi:hypothetical protein
MNDKVSVTFKVGRKHEVTLTYPNPNTKIGGVSAVWVPDVPAAFDARMQRDYLAGRDRFFRVLSEKLKGAVICVDA